MTVTEHDEDLVLTDEREASRFSLTHDGVLVSVLDYRDDGRTIALTRAFTVPSFRGKGYAAQIVGKVVAELEQRGDRQVDAVCWYVAEWFEKHPDHAELLRKR